MFFLVVLSLKKQFSELEELWSLFFTRYKYIIYKDIFSEAHWLGLWGKRVCHVTACMFVHTGPRLFLCFVFLFFFVLRLFSLLSVLYSYCSHELEMSRKVPFSFERRMISKPPRHTICLLVCFILYLSLLCTSSLLHHLSPDVVKKSAALSTDGQNCTIVFFLSVVYFIFSFCTVRFKDLNGYVHI